MKVVVLRKCTTCFEKYPLESYPDCKTGRAGKRVKCRKCVNISQALYHDRKRRADPRYRLLTSSKINARVRRLEHTITIADIPLPFHCRYLDVPLDYAAVAPRHSKRHPYSASIDRIDPNKGYIPGNIQVISEIANRMKTDATIEQLKAFARGILRLYGQ